MKKLLLLIFLAACAVDPVSHGPSNNPDVPIDLLFEHEGCSVFRFLDAGHYHYFTTCSGEVSSVESCGKHCTRVESVQTVPK